MCAPRKGEKLVRFRYGAYFVELGNYSQSSYGNYSSRTFQTFDPVFKYGLPNNFDVEAVFGGYINKWERIGDTTVRLSGFGDITPRIRWNYYNDGPFSAGAFIGVKIPTASNGLGNGQVEYNFVAPVQYVFPHDYTLLFSPEIDLLNNTRGTGKNFNYIADVMLSHHLAKHFVLYGEVFSEHSNDPAQKDIYTADVGVRYKFTPTLMLTESVYIGLNQYSPHFQDVISLAKEF